MKDALGASDFAQQNCREKMSNYNGQKKKGLFAFSVDVPDVFQRLDVRVACVV